MSRFSETISTLRFGTRAKFIKNKPRVHVGYGGTEKDELLRKRDMEIARLKDQIAELTSTMTQVSRENECFRQTYGDLPEEALTSMAADDGGGGGEREDGAGAKPVAREAKLPRQFQRSLEYARLLEAEVFTIGTEARLVRHATEEVRTRIVTQRDVFGEARFAVSKLVSGFASAPEQRREAHAEEVRERAGGGGDPGDGAVAERGRAQGPPAAGARRSRHRDRCQGVPSHVQRRQGKVMVVMTVVVVVVCYE